MRKWVAITAIVLAAVPAGREAAAIDGDPTEARERCAARLSIALLGRGAATELAASDDPQASVDAMLADPRFIERFSRFLNAKFNARPGDTAKEDSAYYLARHVLSSGLPYRDLFLGPFDVDQSADGKEVQVKETPDGLGYFRSLPWLRRYAGNETTGLKISTAYRMMNNTVGLKLVATTNAPDADVSANTRSSGVCKGCHYDNWSALDKAAKVLTRRKGAGETMTFEPPPKEDASQFIADKTVTSDKELVTALVDSESFDFNSCRTAFEFLYGRPENTCEAPVFDRCMREFKAKKTIQSAITAVAKDASFCQ